MGLIDLDFAFWEIFFSVFNFAKISPFFFFFFCIFTKKIIRLFHNICDSFS